MRLNNLDQKVFTAVICLSNNVGIVLIYSKDYTVLVFNYNPIVNFTQCDTKTGT